MSIQGYPINYSNYLTYQNISNNFNVGQIQSYPNNGVIFADSNSILQNPFKNKPEFTSPKYKVYQRLSIQNSNQHAALSNNFGFNQIGYDSNINLIKGQNNNYNGYSTKKILPNIRQPATTIAQRQKAKMNVPNNNSIKDEDYNYNGFSSKNDQLFINQTTNIELFQ